MIQLTLLVIGFIGVAVGSVLGYYARQSIARKQIGTLEERIQKRILQAKKEAETLLANANRKSSDIIRKTRAEEENRRKEILKTEGLILKRENALQEKIDSVEIKEKEIYEKADKLGQLKEKLKSLIDDEIKKLERISSLGVKEAKE